MDIPPGPDADFEVDLADVDMTSIRNPVPDFLRELKGSSIEIADDVWLELHNALANFVAQERYRRLMPSKTQAVHLRSIKSSANSLYKHLRASMKPPKKMKGESGPRSTEFQRFVEDKLPTDSVDALMKCLEALSKMSARTVLYDNPAPELDRKLRSIWAKMSGEVATVHKAEMRQSPYDQFFQIVAGAIPPELVPGDTAGSLADRPEQLARQAEEHRQASRELGSLVNQLAEKLSRNRQG